MVWYTVLKMYKQQNCHSNLCRPVDCLDFKCFHRFFFFFFLSFFISAPFLSTMAERLNIFEALNLANGDRGEENDHKDDCMLFFGCTATPSHALFYCPDPMTKYNYLSQSAFLSFPDKHCTWIPLKPFER